MSLKKKVVKDKKPIYKILVVVLDQMRENSNVYKLNKFTQVISRDFIVQSYRFQSSLKL